MKDSRIVTMEVEARNLDKKVCLERGDLRDLRIKGTGMGGKGEDWPNSYLFLVLLTLGSLWHWQDFLGKSDPFLEFFRQGDGKWHLAYRSEVWDPWDWVE